MKKKAAVHENEPPLFYTSAQVRPCYTTAGNMSYNVKYSLLFVRYDSPA